MNFVATFNFLNKTVASLLRMIGLRCRGYEIIRLVCLIGERKGLENAWPDVASL